jgi:hypothetical protein
MATKYKPDIIRVTEILDSDNQILYEFLPLEIIKQIDQLQQSIDALTATAPTGATGSTTASDKDLNYTHYQSTPSTTWYVQHNLGKIPTVGIFDTAGTELVADITNVDLNNLTIDFAYPTSGLAACN